MTTVRLKINPVKGAIYLLLTIALLTHSIVTQAQTGTQPNVFYQGFDVSFGIRSSKIKSNIPQINEMPLLTEGGSIGVIYGNEVLRSKVNAGFYYSAASMPRTIDQFHAGKIVNFYPIAWKKQKISPLEFYLSSGVEFDILKFAGNYLLDEEGPTNPAVNDDYIGKMSILNLSVGGGVEYKIFDNINFLHLYSEIQQSFSIHSTTRYEAFRGTSVAKQLIVSLGVRFGMVK